MRGTADRAESGVTRLVLDSSAVLALLKVRAETEGHRHGGAVAGLAQSLLDALADHERVEIVLSTPSADALRSPEIGSAEAEELIQRMTPDLAVPSESVARQAQRNAAARADFLSEFGVLTGDQIGEEHSRARNRHALAARWRKEGRVFGVTHRGRMLYPDFQFDSRSGELRPEIRAVLAALPTERMSDWEVALWWTATNGWLSGSRPVDALDEDPDAVAVAAGRLTQPSHL